MTPESIFPVDDADFETVFTEEASMVDASQLIAAALESSGMTKTELAQSLGVSKSEITARLAGERNITVRKLAATLHALGQRLNLSSTSETPSRPASTVHFERWRPQDPAMAKPHSVAEARRSVTVGGWREARGA